MRAAVDGEMEYSRELTEIEQFIRNTLAVETTAKLGIDWKELSTALPRSMTALSAFAPPSG